MADLATTTECPPQAELEKLLRGRCTEARNAALCDHVGSCAACQKRLEVLARSASDLAAQLRECENESLSKDSAYWRAIRSAISVALWETSFAPRHVPMRNCWRVSSQTMPLTHLKKR